MEETKGGVMESAKDGQNYQTMKTTFGPSGDEHIYNIKTSVGGKRQSSGLQGRSDQKMLLKLQRYDIVVSYIQGKDLHKQSPSASFTHSAEIICPILNQKMNMKCA